VSGAANYAGKYVLAEKIRYMIYTKSWRFNFINMEGVKIKRPIQAKQIEDIENINLNLGKR
jgi:hypothetical protein